MSIRSRVSWMLRGSARLDHLERSVDDLRRQVADLSSRQDAGLAEIRGSVVDALDDLDRRTALLDQRTP